MYREKKKTVLPDDDWVAYLPPEEIRTFEHVYENVQKARDFFRQAQDDAEQIEN
jgi:hypothetical protein